MRLVPPTRASLCDPQLPSFEAFWTAIPGVGEIFLNVYAIFRSIWHMAPVLRMCVVLSCHFRSQPSARFFGERLYVSL